MNIRFMGLKSEVENALDVLQTVPRIDMITTSSSYNNRDSREVRIYSRVEVATRQNGTIRVIIKYPYTLPIIADVREEDLREIIGGYIDIVSLPVYNSDMVIILDDDGKLKNRQPNINFCRGDYIAGPVVIAATQGEELVDLTQKQIEQALQYIQNNLKEA